MSSKTLITILSPVHTEEDLAGTWLGNVLILQTDVPRLVKDRCQVVRGCGVGCHLDFLSLGRVVGTTIADYASHTLDVPLIVFLKPVSPVLRGMGSSD